MRKFEHFLLSETEVEPAQNSTHHLVSHDDHWDFGPLVEKPLPNSLRDKLVALAFGNSIAPMVVSAARELIVKPLRFDVAELGR
jgi:hypothetical protein